MFNPAQLQNDFPILQKTVHGKPLIYLDNAATSQKPQVVIDAISNYYQTSNANVHRGVHQLSDDSTHAWEISRATIAQFFGADPAELILTRNTTEALNGVVYGWGVQQLQAGDVIITSLMEHHADIVPWQQLAKKVGAELAFIEVDDQGRLRLDQLESLCKTHGEKVKLVALTYISNALGTLIPLSQIVTQLKSWYPSAATRPKIVIDGAQAAPHIPIDFHKLDIDFLAFSSHKMLGPMGVGGLLVRQELLASNQMQPWLFGGGMIAEVSTEKTIFNDDPVERFTPGTPDVASAVGLAAACKYLQKIGMQQVYEHDQALVQYTIEQLQKIPQVQLIGPTQAQPGQSLDRVGSVTFVYEGVHAHDVAQILDSEGVAVRSGHHCTMPLHTAFEWQASVRVSFQLYNTTAEVDTLVQALDKVQAVFGK